MKAFIITTLTAVAAFVAASSVPAAGGTQGNTATLRAAQDKVARAAERTKGGPRQLLLLEQQRLGKLIDDLERGRSVDPAEIDRAVDQAEHAGW